MPILTDTLLLWYAQNRRDLPWRESLSPYNVWLSEIILQQTQVAQGLPYYLRFLDAYPTIEELAAASEEQVLKLWQGLGYYSRARNLHHTAKDIVLNYNGVFPDTYKGLKKLKGVGDYTASAIASICYKEPVAVLDGNVFRVLSRFLGIDIPINTTAGWKIFKEKAELNLEKSHPGQYNQAIMDFGAIQCKPKKPYCSSCPLQTDCVAFQQGKVAALPVKLKKTKVRVRHLNYLVFRSFDQEVVLQKRVGKGIWRNLYEFPLIETTKETRDSAALLECSHQLSKDVEEVRLLNDKPVKHQLSHQKLLVNFWEITPKKTLDSLRDDRSIVVGLSEIDQFPVPRLIERFLNDFVI